MIKKMSDEAQRAAMQSAFDASPEELGKAAVAAARAGELTKKMGILWRFYGMDKVLEAIIGEVHRLNPNNQIYLTRLEADLSEALLHYRERYDENGDCRDESE